MRKYEQQELVKLMIVGKPGSGKSRLALSSVFIEEMCPVLYLSISGNPISARDYPKKDYTALEVETLQDLYDVGAWLDGEQKLESAFAKTYGITRQFKSFIVDGGTEINKRVANAYVGMDALKFGEMPKDITKLQDYGKLAGGMLNFAKELFSFNMHVIFTTLEQEEGGKVEPAFIGQTRSSILAYPEMVIRLQKYGGYTPEQQEFLITKQSIKAQPFDVIGQYQPSSTVPFVKNQYSAATPTSYIVNPTMETIWKNVIQFK